MATWSNLYMHHLSENTEIQMLGIYSPMTMKYSNSHNGGKQFKWLQMDSDVLYLTVGILVHSR